MSTKTYMQRIEFDRALQSLKSSFALLGKNAGCNLRLCGKVVLLVFFINDNESQWDAKAEGDAIEMLRSSCLKLMSDSKLGREKLQIAYAHCQFTVPYEVNRDTITACKSDVLKKFGYESVEAYQKHYKEKFERNEVAIAFMFNKSFRSYAYSADKPASCTEEDEVPYGDEFSVVSFRNDDLSGSEKTFLHELMHQFGAIDYYYPDTIKEKAAEFLPDSIMDSGTVIDDLTRYIIGWDENPSDAAYDFLDAIRSVTAKDVENARREQWESTEA